MSITIPNPPDSPGGDGLSTSEVATQRRLTTAFINRLPTTVILTPRARQKSPTGGVKWVEGEARDAQTMTLIELGTAAGNPEPVKTVDGIERTVQFELLGEWDAELARYDTFTHQGKDWEVIDLFYDNGYERRALVSARG
jgi:hypothetical protein